MTMRHPILNLFRHALTYGFGDIAGRAVAVILLPIYARLLTDAENGQVAIGFALIGFCAVFYSLGLNQALIKFLSGEAGADTEHSRKRFSSVFWTLGIIASGVTACVYVFSEQIAIWILGTPDHKDIVIMLGAIILLDTLSEPMFSLCRAQQRSKRFAVTRLVQHTLQILLIAYLIAIQGWGVRAVFLANVVSSTVALIIMLPFGVRFLRPTFSLTDLRELLTFGIPFVPSAVSLLIISLSDRLLIEHFLGLEELGVYSITFKIALPMLVIVRAFRSAWAPGLLAVTDPDQARYVCARVTTYFVGSASFLILIVVAFNRELVTLVAGSNAATYLPGAAIIPIVTLGHFFHGFYVILTAGVFAEGRSRILPLVVIAGAIVNVALNLIFIPRFGYIASAWSTVAANGVMVLLLYVNTRKFYPVPFEFGRMAKAAVVALVVSSALNIGDPTFEGTLAKLVILLAYPIILSGWNFIEPGEWHSLRHYLRPHSVSDGASG
jgi:O-antigen/teichoic acid export membrane protein